MYKVTALITVAKTCANDQNQTQWGTWSIKTQALVGTYAIPSTGVIFVKDNVWVDGTVNGTRVTIVAAAVIGQTDPTAYSSITVNNDLRYSHTDGTDTIGLIAQGNVNVGFVSADTLEIDAALIAVNGRIGRYYYSTNCSYQGVDYWHRTSISLNGMIATSLRYGFAYMANVWNCGGSIGYIAGGYCGRTINYDANLLYAPPPSFPQATTQYQVIQWQQIN